MLQTVILSHCNQNVICIGKPLFFLKCILSNNTFPVLYFLFLTLWNDRKMSPTQPTVSELLEKSDIRRHFLFHLEQKRSPPSQKTLNNCSKSDERRNN